ncbi:SixA phosphatase family protein [Methylobacterium sp. A54F]
MLRLLLLRHAKSDRPAGTRDLDRPLNPRGRAAAPRMAAYLAEAGLRPDHALVSPARRTQETLAPVADTFDGLSTQTVETIYEAPSDALLDAIRAAPDTVRTLLMVGHNPGMQDLAERLAGSGERAARVRLRTQFPTAALAVIDFEEDHWSAVAWGNGRLERFVRPRDLAAELAD